MKNKYLASFFAFLLGGFGIHQLYLGNQKKSILYLLFFWTIIPSIIGIIESIQIILMKQEVFDLKFNNVNLKQPNKLKTNTEPASKNFSDGTSFSYSQHQINRYLNYTHTIDLDKIEQNSYPQYSYNWYLQQLIENFRKSNQYHSKEDSPFYANFKDLEYQINYLNISNDLPIIDYWEYFSVALSKTTKDSLA